MEKHEWSLDELRNKAESYCASAEHCSSEVKTKLQQWGANQEYITHILNWLQSEGYVDEMRYCKAFAHDKLLYQGWGRMKIKAALYAKYLAKHLIEEAINDIDENEYHRILKRVITSKQKTLKNDVSSREKIIRFCLQRGFTYDEIEKQLNAK